MRTVAHGSHGNISAFTYNPVSGGLLLIYLQYCFIRIIKYMCYYCQERAIT